MVDADPWSSFSHDPRRRAHAPLRACDADRDHVIALLSTAYADGRIERDELDERMTAAAAVRTLGEVPPLVADLVPLRPSRPLVPSPGRSLVGLPPDELHARAVEKWRDQRGGAAYVLAATSLLAWGFIAASGFDAWWLLLFNALALLHLGRLLLAREQIVRDHQRRFERRQARQQLLRQRLPRALPWER